MTKFNLSLLNDQACQDARSLASGTSNDAPSRTKKGAAADCDINRMMQRMGVTKVPVPREVYDPNYYGDLTGAPLSLQEALDRVRQARERFDALPARLRAEFDNSPAALWDWINDPANGDEAVELGLLHRVPAPSAPGTDTGAGAPETGTSTP